MGDIVNLRRARKQAARQAAEQKAAANRALHGRSKAQRKLDRTHETKSSGDLDGHLIERKDKR
jgi:chorismate mutase